MPMFPDVFSEIAAVLLTATVIGSIGVLLRQPLIVSFIAAGLLAGPAGFGWVSSADQVDLLAKFGIALLLFVVGLKLDIHLIRTTGPVALATGLGQVLFTALIGYVIALALGFAPVAALYVAVALTFSSTIIIVKLLSDKREIDALHGRIAVGLLIVQDLVVVAVMIGLSAFGVVQTNSAGLTSQLAAVLLKGAGFLILLGLIMRYVLPGLLRRLALSQELLVLFAISWAVTLAAVGAHLGFSKEVGAFLAGIALASTSYREAIASRLVSLRDFLLLFFFIDLGAQLDPGLLGAHVGQALVLSLFVLIGNPLIVMAIMGVMGYRKRTGFLTGLTVAQISEFSLILAALGVSLGHIDAHTMGLITLVGLVTIGLSTYLILYSHALYDRFASWLDVFERSVPHREQAGDSEAYPLSPDVVVFGMGRYGGEIIRGLKEGGLSVLGIDFDPDVISSWRTEGVPVRYGDAEDPEFLATIPLPRSGLVISTAHELSVNLALLASLRHHAFSGRTAMRVNRPEDSDALMRAGAEVILSPFADGAAKAVDALIALRRRDAALSIAGIGSGDPAARPS
jgi:predicted Kef-type K+ transport protein